MRVHFFKYVVLATLMVFPCNVYASLINYDVTGRTEITDTSSGTSETSSVTGIMSVSNEMYDVIWGTEGGEAGLPLFGKYSITSFILEFDDYELYGDGYISWNPYGDSYYNFHTQLGDIQLQNGWLTDPPNFWELGTKFYMDPTGITFTLILDENHSTSTDNMFLYAEAPVPEPTTLLLLGTGLLGLTGFRKKLMK